MGVKAVIENLSRKIKPFFETLSENKKLAAIISLGLVGMMLIALSSFGGEKKRNEEKPKEQIQFVESGEFEKTISDFLSNISGAGRVEVMLTYDSGKESVYATDNGENSLKGENGREEIKTSSEHIIIKTDSGESGLEIKEIYPKIRGVAVICDGGSNPVIKEQITLLLCALFDINSTQISVAAMAA